MQKSFGRAGTEEAAEGGGVMATVTVTPKTPRLSPEQALEQWVAERQKFIGGSEAFELLNEAQYGLGCWTALGFRKLGIEPDYPEDQIQTDPMKTRGKILEPLVTMLYEDQTARKLRRPPMNEYGLSKPKYHPQHPWAAVSTDRIIMTGAGGVTSPGDLEIKTRSEGPWLRVQRQGPFPGDILQPQWSLFITGHLWGSLATLGVFGSLPLSWFDVNKSEELQQIFVEQGEKFANEVWGHGRPPEPVIPSTDKRCKVCVYRMTCRGEEIDREEAAELRAINKSSKSLVQITNPELAHTLNDIDLLKQEKDSIESSLEIAKEQALSQLGEVDAALLKGYGKVYRQASKANYLDVQSLKADEPDLYSKYFISRLTGGHHLRLYPFKEKSQ